LYFVPCPKTIVVFRANVGGLERGPATIWFCIVDGGFGIDWFELAGTGVIITLIRYISISATMTAACVTVD